MRVVIDTNVFVSALLTPGRTPERLLRLLHERDDTPLYDHRTLSELEEVLARPKFAMLCRQDVAFWVAWVRSGYDVGQTGRWDGAMTDDSDMAFVEVAVSGGAELLVTGNRRHYPADELPFDVVEPAELLRRLQSGR